MPTSVSMSPLLIKISAVALFCGLIVIFTKFLFFLRKNKKEKEAELEERKKKKSKEDDKKILFFLDYDFFPLSVDEQSQKIVNKKLCELASNFFNSRDHWFKFRQLAIERKEKNIEESIILKELTERLFPKNTSFVDLGSMEEYHLKEIQDKKSKFWKAHNLARDFGFEVNKKISQYDF
ncbi:MAG: hypothetical protein NT161_00490 [Candidatus Nomurabacteria bacterium]|nr:hypothetical protein [Candidatus Nomurabacteria bacterium]